MKKAISIITFLMVVHSVSLAQDLPAAGSYTTNNTMSAFHGTWQWASGTDTVRIYLTTQKVFFPINGGYYWDNIVGWHIYKKGNQIIESSFTHINTPFDNGYSTILAGNENNSTVLEGSLKDITKNKDCVITLTLNAAQNKLTWRSRMGEGLHIYPKGQVPPPPGLTLPKNMVLTKL